MRILVDTDVLLDVALNRPDFVEHSADVLKWCEQSGGGAVAWHSLSNCDYLLKGHSRKFISGLLEILTVAPVGHREALMALNMNLSDLEDTMQAAAAVSWNADGIVTRNVRHFTRSPVSALSPSTFLKKIR